MLERTQALGQAEALRLAPGGVLKQEFESFGREFRCPGETFRVSSSFRSAPADSRPTTLASAP